jgi:hypothetical protein
MSTLDVENIVVAVRYEGRIRWFRCDRDWWVMDVYKWRNEFIQNGYDVPEFNDAYRFGFKVVNEKNAGEFLACLKDYEVAPDTLAMELAKRYQTASSWWDVGDLFPVMFVDFDRHEVGAFYSQGAAMERYVPDGWTGQFIDFATEYPEEVFPTSSKFWVKGGVDLLALLNKRGAEGG